MVSCTVHAEKTENITHSNLELQGAVTFWQLFIAKSVVYKPDWKASSNGRECKAECKHITVLLLTLGILTIIWIMTDTEEGKQAFFKKKKVISSIMLISCVIITLPISNSSLKLKVCVGLELSHGLSSKTV